MKKLIFGFSLFCMGIIVSSCVDKNEEVDEDSMPEFLGNSVYDALKAPHDSLQGTFNTYLRLVDDMGLAETLQRTGSKTVFPANDEAFDRFFQTTTWKTGSGSFVRSYEDLSYAQKRLLVLSSQLDNAMLVKLMANVSGSSDVIRGQAMKHATSVSVIDSVTHIDKPSEYFKNNPYFKELDVEGGADFIFDNTAPMMIHFTKEFMLNHSLTTLGETSDFSVLTGQTYQEGDGYVFRNKIIRKDITCQNGYVHQVDNVIVPPGNLAQVIHQEEGNTTLFSRMLDRFALPYPQTKTTSDYRASAAQYGWREVPTIYEVRYMSTLSHDTEEGGQSINYYPGTTTQVNTLHKLPFDPGWNRYYLATGQTGTGDGKLSDVAAMLVPNDDAIRSYFLPENTYQNNEGKGAFLIDRFGTKPNTLENLAENIDSIPQDKVTIILKNLMKTQMTKTVPSLFSSVTNNASDLMGLSLDDVRKNEDGSYDVRIANNGVIYILNRMIPPPDFSAVSAPATVSDSLKIMNWLIQNKSAKGYTVSGSSVKVDKYEYSIDLDYYTYLLAMTAWYAQFLPLDEGFNNNYYVNAASLSTQQPEAMHLYWDPRGSRATGGFAASRWKYNPTTHAVTDSIGKYDLTGEWDIVKSMLVEMVNMHTIVLQRPERLGQNNYYTTKLGAGVRVTGGAVGDKLGTSAQQENGLRQPEITKTYVEENGVAYVLDGLLQPPTQSVYDVVRSKTSFKKFQDACDFFENTAILNWLGISSDVDAVTGLRPSDQYLIFASPTAKGYNPKAENPDVNTNYMNATYRNNKVVKMFNTFNYTVFIPNDDAMTYAEQNGLPTAAEIETAYTNYENGTDMSDDARSTALKKARLLQQFLRYHFMNNTVFADNYGVTNTPYSTFTSNADNISLKLYCTVSGGRLSVKDENQEVHVIDANDSGKVSNAMTRDVILDAIYDKAKTVYTSSFAVCHEIDKPLCPSADGRFDTLLGNYSDGE